MPAALRSTPRRTGPRRRPGSCPSPRSSRTRPAVGPPDPSSLDLPAPPSPVISTTPPACRGLAAAADDRLQLIARPTNRSSCARLWLSGLAGRGGRAVQREGRTGASAVDDLLPLAEDRLLQARPGPGPGSRPELVAEHPPGLAERGQRVRLPVAGPQRQRQQPPAFLAQRLLAGQHRPRTRPPRPPRRCAASPRSRPPGPPGAARPAGPPRPPPSPHRRTRRSRAAPRVPAPASRSRRAWSGSSGAAASCAAVSRDSKRQASTASPGRRSA